jgi:hypothetical protein
MARSRDLVTNSATTILWFAGSGGKNWPLAARLSRAVTGDMAVLLDFARCNGQGPRFAGEPIGWYASALHAVRLYRNL